MKLPDKPSELILVAIDDLVKCEEDPNYSIFMYDWHAPIFKEPCYVCLAGSVMAKSLGADVKESLVPSSFDHDTSNKLIALDNFRVGNVQGGMQLMNIKNDHNFETIIWGYSIDPTRFKEEMILLAFDLDNEGL